MALAGLLPGGSAGPTSSSDATAASGSSSAAPPSTQASAAPASTPASASDATEVDLGSADALPRAVLVGTDGRSTVLLTGPAGGTVLTVDGGRVTRRVPVDTDALLLDLVPARDAAGDDLAVVLGQKRGGDAAVTEGRAVTLLAVSGDVVAERPVRPPAMGDDEVTPRVAISPDGRTLYVLTGGVRPPEVSAVDVGTGIVKKQTTLDPGFAGVIDRLALTVDGAEMAWAALSGPGGASLVQLSPLLDVRSTTTAPDTTIDAVAVGAAGPLVARRGDGLAVVTPTVTDDGKLSISGELLAGTAIAVAGTTLAVSHEGVGGKPTVSIGELGGQARTITLCPGDGDTWDVAAGPGSTFTVTGTCDGRARLWQVR